MSKDLLVVYEPALFLLAALGWAGWELWSVRTKKGDGAEKGGGGTPSSDPPAGS